MIIYNENDTYMRKLIYDHLSRDGAVWRYDEVPNRTNTLRYLFYLLLRDRGPIDEAFLSA